MYSEIIRDRLKDYEDKDELTELYIEKNRIKAADWLGSVAKDIDGIDKLSLNIVNKQGGNYILYKFADPSGSCCKGAIKIVEDLHIELNNLLTKIAMGQSIIQALNSKLEAVRAENGILLSLRYKFGLTKTCKIAYWDYATVVIYSSEDMINSLINNAPSSELGDYIDGIVNGTAWNDNIAEFIAQFNELPVNIRIQAKVDTSDIKKLLQENMILASDVEDIIIKNKEKTGSQRIKSVKIIDSQLGLFAAVIIWTVDYDTKDISADIMEDKVVDLENSRFISDHSLYSRIEQIIGNEADAVAEKFKFTTS